MFSKDKEKDPRWSPLFSKACKLSEEGKHQEAIDTYNEILKFDPESWVVWNNKGAVYKDLGMEEEYKQCMQISHMLHVFGI